MQENEFEKRVQQKMDEFTLLPKDDVWNKVEARIKKEKDRKPLFMWMLAALLLSGGALWYNKSKIDYVPGAAITATKASKKTSVEAFKANTVEQTVLDKKENLRNEKHELQPKQTSVSKDIATRQPRSIIKTSHLSNIKNDDFGDENEKSIESEKNLRNNDLKQTMSYSNKAELKSLLDENISTAEKNSSLPLHKFYKSSSDLKRDSIELALTIEEKSKELPVVKRDLTKEKIEIEKTILQTNPWKFGFTLYGGISNNVNGINLVQAKSLSSPIYASPSSNSIPGSNNNNANAIELQYKSRTSFGAGIFVRKYFSKRLSLSIGLDYHYFSASSLVGYGVNSSRTIYDSALSRRASVTQYYGSGDTTSFVNKYYLLQMPVDIVFRINKNLNKPALFSFGLSPSLLIGSNALYLNRSSNIYYQDKTQFKNFMLFGQTALQFTPFTSVKYSISAGPVFQYGFNSFTKSQTGTQQHLLFTGLKTNIIFK